MKLRTLIIDDEPIALEKLKNYVGKVSQLELAGTCRSAVEALEIMSANDVDLVITDINMPDLNGMEFIESLSFRPMVIFTTAYQQYAVDSYKLSAVDYLLKPYGFADFQRAVNKALELNKSRYHNPAITPGADDSLFIKVDYRYVRIHPDEISFIKGYGEYLQIFVKGSATPLLTLSSFAAIKEKLPQQFKQTHRSYIVNMNNVDLIERNRIVIGKENYIPIGDSFKAEVMEYISSHSIGRH